MKFLNVLSIVLLALLSGLLPGIPALADALDNSQILAGPQGCNAACLPNLWPQSVIDHGMDIGGVHYSAAQLCAILNLNMKDTGDDGLPALSHEIIAARLNIANGADSTDAQAALDAADLMINGKMIGVVSIPTSQTSSLTNTLRAYNEGETGPGACVADPGCD